MKGELSRTILLILAKIGEGTATLISDSFLSPKYRFTKPTRWLLGLDSKTKNSKRPTISTTLSRLKREGLVAKIGSTKNAKWRLTAKGRSILKKTLPTALPKEDGKLRIVMFDIPEKESVKRRWLRSELISCNYQLLQKSVWLGKRPLPESLLKEIDALGLINYLHILEISRGGTIIEGG